MKVEQAVGRLLEMLDEASLAADSLDPERTWAVFKTFAEEPVEGTGPAPEDDMCLFECGTFDWFDGKGARFQWTLCRQFTLYTAAGECDHVEQLRCDLFFDSSATLNAIEVDGIWSGADLAGWVAAVEAEAGFREVLHMTPDESRVEQAPV